VKRATISCAAILSASLLIGCGGGKTDSGAEQTVDAPMPKASLGNLSPEGSLENMSPKDRAEKIRSWTKMGIDPKLVNPAVAKYKDDPDPDVAEAAKESLARTK